MSNRKNWKPLQQADISGRNYRHPEWRNAIERMMKEDNCTYEEVVARMEAYDAKCSYWRNDLYQVQVRECFSEKFNQPMVHLNIRRIDGAAVFDWRHRQWIKNQLVGEECEGFELYPAESRLNDTSNKYHLWVFKDPEYRIPVGMFWRDVVDHEVTAPAGLRQRRP